MHLLHTVNHSVVCHGFTKLTKATSNTHTYTHLPHCPKLDCGKSLGKGRDQKICSVFSSFHSSPPLSGVTQLSFPTDQRRTTLLRSLTSQTAKYN